MALPGLLEIWNGGRTPGKAALGLEVLRGDSKPLGWSQSVVRNLLRAADALPATYLVGLLAMLASPLFKRLGDRAAGALVVQRDAAVLRAPRLPDARPAPPRLALDLEEQRALLAPAPRAQRRVPSSLPLGAASRVQLLEIQAGGRL